MRMTVFGQVLSCVFAGPGRPGNSLVINEEDAGGPVLSHAPPSAAIFWMGEVFGERRICKQGGKASHTVKMAQFPSFMFAAQLLTLYLSWKPL